MSFHSVDIATSIRCISMFSFTTLHNSFTTRETWVFFLIECRIKCSWDTRWIASNKYQAIISFVVIKFRIIWRRIKVDGINVCATPYTCSLALILPRSVCTFHIQLSCAMIHFTHTYICWLVKEDDAYRANRTVFIRAGGSNRTVRVER